MEDNAGPVTECERSTGACARSKPPAGSDSQPPRRERSARLHNRVPIPSRILNNQWSSLHIIYPHAFCLQYHIITCIWMYWHMLDAREPTTVSLHKRFWCVFLCTLVVSYFLADKGVLSI
ncbi:unnamed protein product [Arctia plantaginis]|uniref:Uncharacterized protein n=1 Tax=Arctia plantaginis TaxID=874455 RepID=A0A8S0ZU04_ARCPL|nr:unnamed protein product [Arctia plantaginis]CAB3261117.1 unnamed protein product [Arctia plantaginis]